MAWSLELGAQKAASSRVWMHLQVDGSGIIYDSGMVAASGQPLTVAGNKPDRSSPSNYWALPIAARVS
jgi:hypothetical protein